MRLLFAIAALTLPLGSASAEKVPMAPHRDSRAGLVPPCDDALVRYARKDGEEAQAKRLGELPPGNLLLTVVNDVGGCHVPVIVRYGVGAAASRSPGPPAAARAARRPMLVR